MTTTRNGHLAQDATRRGRGRDVVVPVPEHIQTSRVGITRVARRSNFGGLVPVLEFCLACACGFDRYPSKPPPVLVSTRTEIPILTHSHSF